MDRGPTTERFLGEGDGTLFGSSGDFGCLSVLLSWLLLDDDKLAGT